MTELEKASTLIIPGRVPTQHPIGSAPISQPNRKISVFVRATSRIGGFPYIGGLRGIRCEGLHARFVTNESTNVRCGRLPSQIEIR